LSIVLTARKADISPAISTGHIMCYRHKSFGLLTRPEKRVILATRHPPAPELRRGKTAMTTRTLLCLLAISSALAINPILARSQTAPLPVGTWTLDSPPATCPTSAGWLASGICKHYTVSCPGADPLGVTINYVAPNGTSNGTIAFVAAEGGTSPNTNVGQESVFGNYYLSKGFAVVQTAWDSDWEDTDTAGDSGSDSMLVAGCRPATVLSAINSSSTYHPTGAMCAQGASAGSGGAAFSLEWYGAKKYLNNVELISGPVFSDMEKGCEVPVAGNVTACSSTQLGCNNEYGNTQSWTNAPDYVDFYITAVQGWVGAGTTGTTYSCRNPGGTSQQAD